MEPVCLTNDNFNCQLIYFTSSNLTIDDENLVFISDKSGNPNIYVLNIPTNMVIQLTNNKEGFLKSYQYFRGNEGKGLGIASVTLHASSETIYYLQGHKICSVDLNKNYRVLAEYPNDQVTAYMSVSHDGTRLCVSTTDARAIEDDLFEGWCPDHNIDKRIHDENLNSYLRVYDTSNGKEIVTEPVSKAWVTHVQFCPVDKNIILYNHEWPSYDGGSRRMWLYNGEKHIKLRPAADGKDSNDWVCHEIWARDGKAIIYHGGYKDGTMFLGKVKADGSELVEIKLPKNYYEYGHFIVGNSDTTIVTDGYYRESNKIENVKYSLIFFVRKILRIIISNRLKILLRRFYVNENSDNLSFGKWISILKVDWEKKRINWVPLIKHGSINCRTDQDSHPHPIFNHKGNEIFFTSNRNGNRSIFKLKL